MPRDRPTQVSPVVDRLAAYAWRLLVIAAVLAGMLWLVGKLWVVFLPLVLAAFLSRVLIGPANWLRGHSWPPALAAVSVLLGFVLLLGAVLGLVGVAVGQQSDQIGPTVSQSIDDIENWLVKDGPGDLTHKDIQNARDDATEWLEDWFSSSGSAVASGVVVAFEVLVGIVLGLVITFFALKDGARFTRWILTLVPAHQREPTRRLARSAWATLGGYLRGAALLGLLEGVLIGAAVALVGGQLAVPVGLITFIMAFIPFAGAIFAGAIAVLVTLSTAGIGGALIVLAVAVLVQQFDNDLLAPVIYGKQLDLHPVVILLAITGGGAAFGIAGAFLAVPVTAVVINMVAEYRRIQGRPIPSADPPEEALTAADIEPD
ncbi:MAG TPA: AI-2E family transporter [Acidimicrobiales bacterium]|nr:AI-2E family transporter [Acidimicrobiales bacterium]